ncbi:MAG: response regulator transcription factor [Candidatus Omnitrophota bacterium]|nr:response regulator transcription factor [Candidatus Omnitrophota bacterium]MBU1894189.1 response regulator transcription factor [Candidatus Omnitrophota bacterium]
MREKLIVIVDDENEIVNTVSEYLSNKGFKVKGCSDGDTLFKFLTQEKPDLIILDLSLPGIDGFEICKTLKAKESLSAIPIIIVSALDEEMNKISGLDSGADDYMVKPFSLNELNSRIKAVLRRQVENGFEEKKITIGNGLVVIDLTRYEVTVNQKKIELTATEFKILERLSTRKGQVFSRDNILDYLWGEEKIVVERTIDVHIRHLREKLGEAGNFIKNVRGIGYKLEETAT